MHRFIFLKLATLFVLLDACSVIDVPLSNATGNALPMESSISITSVSDAGNDLDRQVHGHIEREIVRAGYRLAPDAPYVLDFALSKRPLEIGVMVSEGNIVASETEIWRSRPVDRHGFDLCKASLYRLIIVISNLQTGEIVTRASSENDLCDRISDEKLKTMVSVALARVRGPPR